MKFSNIFVLSTGRCGSTTFVKSCSHIKNYAAKHESRIGLLQPERLNYPSNHIESDNRLSWFLGPLFKRFGNNAMYVHLFRNKADCVKSLTKRMDFGIMRAYSNGILLNSVETDAVQFCNDYYDTVNSNIEQFLIGKPFQIKISMDDPISQFKTFWNMIGAQGDLSLALNEWDVKHNASN